MAVTVLSTCHDAMVIHPKENGIVLTVCPECGQQCETYESEL